jgi:hypothetical protein
MIHLQQHKNYDMVAIKRLTLKTDKVLKNSVKNVSYNVRILISIG